MKRTLYEILVAMAFMLIGGILLCASAKADENQIAYLAEQWNNHDVLAAQRDFSRELAVVPYQADFAALASQGKPLFVENVLEVLPDFYAVKVRLGEEDQVWLMESQEGKWTWFGYRPFTSVGSASLSQGADLASTGLGLSMGFAEANPLGLGILPLKFGLLSATHTMEYADCIGWRTSLDTVGLGAGVMNLATIFLGVNPILGLAGMVITAFARHDAAMMDASFECAEFQLGGNHV